jgi:hypothetical protein
MRRAVLDALAQQFVRDAVPRATPDRPSPPPGPKGRSGTWKCAACQALHPSYAAAERHADTHNGELGARIEFEL